MNHEPCMGPDWKLESGPVPYWRSNLLAGIPWIRHGFSSVQGGVSQGSLASLNLGLHVGDDPRRVEENRRRFMAAVGFPAVALTCANQVHGVRIHRVTDEDRGRGAFSAADALADTDALVTDRPGIALGVFVADCVPILVVDPKKRVVAAIHAGWRGTVQRIPALAILAMQEWYGTDPRDCVAAIGPSAGPCCYQVDQTVFQRFETAGWDTGSIFAADGTGHWKLDLWRANWESLKEIGLSPSNVTTIGVCTACTTPDWCFSHRASGGHAGRMAAVIGITE